MRRRARPADESKAGQDRGRTIAGPCQDTSSVMMKLERIEETTRTTKTFENVNEQVLEARVPYDTPSDSKHERERLIYAHNSSITTYVWSVSGKITPEILGVDGLS